MRQVLKPVFLIFIILLLVGCKNQVPSSTNNWQEGLDWIANNSAKKAFKLLDQKGYLFAINTKEPGNVIFVEMYTSNNRNMIHTYVNRDTGKVMKMTYHIVKDKVENDAIFYSENPTDYISDAALQEVEDLLNPMDIELADFILVFEELANYKD